MLRVWMATVATTWRKKREHRNRLRRAPELIMRAHLLMKDREIRELKRQLAETRQRVEGLEVDLYRARLANQELVWARLQAHGLHRAQGDAVGPEAMARVLDEVAKIA